MSWANCNIKECECFITSQSNAVLNDLKDLGFNGLVKPDDWQKFGEFVDKGKREVIEILRKGQKSVLDQYIKKKLFFKMKIGEERIKDNPEALEELKWQQIHMANNYKKNLEKAKESIILYEDDDEELESI